MKQILSVISQMTQDIKIGNNNINKNKDILNDIDKIREGIEDYIELISISNINMVEYLNKIKPQIMNKKDIIEIKYNQFLRSYESIIQLLQYDISIHN